ncbi:GAF and ANTAR domain-containing protein [Nocardioides sp. 503]|uniref:GAF and ANTAR domain-containing protein n=1 Tax=Nocardioides sp. 503 TaxID=2508326 RepID=UPI0010703169|nr:GAF and ANTAR domain-containing protein [Nocardioides sp. 503]
MTDGREREIIRAFVNLSNDLADEYDVIDMLTTLTSHCADLLDVSSAGLLLADSKGVLHLAASSSERAEHLETFQLQRDEGPCLDSHRNDEVVSVSDLSAEDGRWPQFAPAARAAGFTSVHAQPMRLRHQNLGTLGLFANRAGLLGQDDQELVQALAHVASVAIVNEAAASDSATVNAQLQRALTSRIVLEQAKGVIAHTGSVEMEEAFNALRRFARDRGRKLSDVAAAIVNRDESGATILAHAESVSIPPSR